MKKVICIIISMLILISGISVFADNETSDTMEKALVEVKKKIEVNEELSKFSPHAYNKNESIVYNFNWQNEKGDKFLEVSCDLEGRISNYYYYDSALRSGKKITKLSKNDIISFAESFMVKTLPEAFSNENDRLIYDETSWNVNNLNYSLSYKRYYNGIEVKDNYANITIGVCNDVPYIRDMSVNFDYKTEFVSSKVNLENYTDMYMKAFPVEIIYTDKYSYDDSDNTTVLLYRIKDGDAGYISVTTGEVIEEDENYSVYSGGATEDSSNMMLQKHELTDEERKELENIKGLISTEDAEKILRNLPYVGLGNELELVQFSINENDGEYFVSVNYEFESDNGSHPHISATINGTTGVVTRLQNYKDVDVDSKNLTDQQKNNGILKIEEFLRAAAAEEYSNCKEQENKVTGNVVYVDYDRYVNGIRYIDDGIRVNFDVAHGVVSNYRLDYDNNKDFENPVDAISTEAAYQTMLEISPIKKIYILNNNKFVECYTLSSYDVKINAFTGEKYNPHNNDGQKQYKYTDISGHWAEEVIQKLAEVQIGFKGDNFEPDAVISQSDLLRIFAAGVKYKSYLDYDEDDLYENLIYEKIITEEERNPQSQVSREDAFVYMVRLDGLEKVAKLWNIYKVEYADGYLLSDGKIGYPAILTGMKIICGDGGYLRPQEAITRAEAATMVYNYMVNAE